MPDLDFASVLTDSSRSLMDYTAASVGDDRRQFARLLELARNADYPLCMRAARVADFACERNPDLVRPHLAEIVRDLPGIRDMSVKRIFLHILVRHSWADDGEATGKLLDALIRWLHDERQAISVKAYALLILENIAKLYPDLKSEFALIIEEAIPRWDSDALRNAAGKVLKRLRIHK